MNNNKLGQLISGIQRRDHKVLSEIYRQYYPLVLGYIIRHGGGDSEAKDVFQESIMIVYNLVREQKLEIKTDFGSYLMGVAKRIWLRHLRNKSTHQKYLDTNEFESSEEHPSDKEIENEMEMSLIRKHIVRLGKECQQVLRLVAEGKTNDEIAKIMNYKSEKTVRTKKYKCKEALIKFIKSDPEYLG